MTTYGCDMDGFCVFDNAPCHAGIEQLNLNGLLDVKRLPKYNPFLNMGKNTISTLKAKIKQDLASRQLEFIAPTPNKETAKRWRISNTRY